jgi:hypothetical protein
LKKTELSKGYFVKEKEEGKMIKKNFLTFFLNQKIMADIEICS